MQIYLFRHSRVGGNPDRQHIQLDKFSVAHGKYFYHFFPYKLLTEKCSLTGFPPAREWRLIDVLVYTPAFSPQSILCSWICMRTGNWSAKTQLASSSAFKSWKLGENSTGHFSVSFSSVNLAFAQS